jgi:hypothetical protein
VPGLTFGHPVLTIDISQCLSKKPFAPTSEIARKQHIDKDQSFGPRVRMTDLAPPFTPSAQYHHRCQQSHALGLAKHCQISPPEKEKAPEESGA